jgi:hypothetical protein
VPFDVERLLQLWSDPLPADDAAAADAPAERPPAEPRPESAAAPAADPPAAAPTADEPAPLDAGRAEEILVGVLDDLGAARHRPFSRG